MALKRSPSGRIPGTSLALAILLAGSSPVRAADPVPEAPGPELRRRLEIVVVASGAAAGALGLLLDVDRRFVPAEGLDRSKIRLDLDRRSLGRRDEGADRASEWTTRASVALPFALAFGRETHGERSGASHRRALLYAEAGLLTAGITEIVKRASDRPRPYTYLDEAERAPRDADDIRSGDAFASQPSGHTAVAWCAAGYAITDHLLTRPRAGWREHAVVGFAGGLLATATGALRVEAGEHFPSDAATGALIGATAGVGIPLLHRYVIGSERARTPSPAACLGAAGGAAAGLGAALLLVPALYDR